MKIFCVAVSARISEEIECTEKLTCFKNEKMNIRIKIVEFNLVKKL